MQASVEVGQLTDECSAGARLFISQDGAVLWRRCGLSEIESVGPVYMATNLAQDDWLLACWIQDEPSART